jgi:superfamily I DNA/RNA helicase
MIKQISFSDFCDAFQNAGRENSFSYRGKKELYNFFEENYPDMELDIVALDCEFSESETAVQWMLDACHLDKLKEFADDLGIDHTEPTLDWSEVENEEELEQVCLEYLNNKTLVISFTGGVIVQGF